MIMTNADDDDVARKKIDEAEGKVKSAHEREREKILGENEEERERTRKANK